MNATYVAYATFQQTEKNVIKTFKYCYLCGFKNIIKSSA